MKPFSITQFGDSILRKKARKFSLTEIKKASFRNFVRRMLFTMNKAQGIGLAAPQVGESVQLMIVGLHATRLRPGLQSQKPIVFVNPVIVGSSKILVSDWEACLSLPGVYAMVPRPDEIIVRYYNERGELIVQKATGLFSRVIQHEIDHLNGVLYVDRMKDMATLITESELIKRLKTRKSRIKK